MDTQPNQNYNIGFDPVRSDSQHSTGYLHLTGLFLSLCEGEITHAAVVGQPMIDGPDISAYLEHLRHTGTDMKGVLRADNRHTLEYGGGKRPADVPWDGGFQANYVIDKHDHFIACARSVPPAIADGLKQSTVVGLSLTTQEFQWEGQFGIKMLPLALGRSFAMNNPAAMAALDFVGKDSTRWTKSRRR